MSGDRGICLKKYELESLLKSFALFFLLMVALYVLVATLNYRDQQRQLEEQILNEMKIFSFKPIGQTFQVSFVPKKGKEKLMHLYHGKGEVYALFEIPGSEKFLLKIIMSDAAYQHRLEAVRAKAYALWPLIVLVIAGLALLFALFSLHPFREAMRLNEEFVKDILHDINTPLSSLRINLNILEKRYGEERSVLRMHNAIETIESLQANLKAFLYHQPGTKEVFSLNEMMERKLEYFRLLYPDLHYEMKIDPQLMVECNRHALQRILENLLSNAGKYNKKRGMVRIVAEGNLLRIEDSGQGIENPQRVFERFYKESERGLGLGLHIVRKLADELGIGIQIESELGKGTRVELDLSQVIVG